MYMCRTVCKPMAAARSAHAPQEAVTVSIEPQFSLGVPTQYPGRRRMTNNRREKWYNKDLSRLVTDHPVVFGMLLFVCVGLVLWMRVTD